MTSLCRPTRTFLSALRSLCRFLTKALNCVFVIDQENIRFLILDTFCWGKVLTLFSELTHENLQEVLETCRGNFLFPLKCSVLCWLKILLFWCMKFSVYIWFCFVLYCIFLCACAALKSFSLFCTKSWDFSSAAFPKRGGTTTTRVGTWRPGDTFSGPSCSFTHWLQN